MYFYYYYYDQVIGKEQESDGQKDAEQALREVC